MPVAERAVEAHTVRMRPVRVVLPLVLAGSVLTPALAGAGYEPPKPKDAAAAQRIAAERQVTDLVNKANRRVSQRDEKCEPHSPFEDRQPPTQHQPSQAVLDALAPLRRPSGREDALPGNGSGDLLFGQLYASSVRSVTAADGTRLTILVARLDASAGQPPKRCRTLARAELVRLLKGRPSALRRRALRLQDHAGRPSGPHDGIFLFTRSGARLGGGGGGGDVKDFLAHGAFNSLGGGGRGSRLSGLLPDGVASVTLQFPKRVSRGRNYKPRVFPSAFTRTVRVQENVVSLRVPRGAEDAFPARMVWRASDGSVVRVVEQR